MKEVRIEKNDAGQRLDKFLLKTFPNLKKSALYKGVRNKKIKVNRKRCTFDQQLQEGDIILLFLPPDLLEEKQVQIQKTEPIEVVFENEDLLIVDKPKGLLSMKDQAGQQDTLNDRVRYYLYSTGAYDPKQEHSFLPSIAHRLDRNTSGLVMTAKNAVSARKLSEDIKEHRIVKSYLALTDRRPQQGRVVLYLKKEGTQALIKDQPTEGYDPAIMTVTTIQEKDGRYLSKIDLETGRFHQIRASLAHLGTPLLGDAKYGGIPNKNGYQLQAYQIDLSASSFPDLGIITLDKNDRLHL